MSDQTLAVETDERQARHFFSLGLRRDQIGGRLGAAVRKGRDQGETPNQWEHYVLQENGAQIPVGALIAREFIDDGAEFAFFTEMWHGVVFIGPDLVCVDPPPRVKDFYYDHEDRARRITRPSRCYWFFP